MAAAYTWHPRVDVTNPRWPLAQNLLEDELLTSWLVRNAFAHGCSPLVLTGHLWPSWRCWTLDLDRGLTPDQSQLLSKAVGIAVSDISSCTLRPIAQSISPWIDAGTATWPWIMVIGGRNRRHAGGLQCCPFCLEEGVPYYRLSWRLAWHTCCERHMNRLIDSCVHCGAPLQPHRLDYEIADCSKCYRCGHRLVGPDGLCLDPAALAFQIDGDRYLNGDQRVAESGFGDSQQWFYHSRFVWGLLRESAVHDTKAFTRFREIFRIGKLSSPSSGLAIEMLPVNERVPFLSAVWKIMATGQDQLHEAIMESSMTRTSVSLPAGESPVMLRRVLGGLPLARPYTKSHVPVLKRATPRAVVMRMWARLKRKVLRDG